MKKNSFNYFLWIKRHSFIAVVLFYAIINIIFARVFWRELITDSSKTGAVFGEILATEWNMEMVYQNLIQGRNPFAGTLDMLYPFGSNYISTDSGNGFLFLFLRPFLSSHQSFFILSAIALFLANTGMYLLLRALQVRRSIAFMIGLAFGYMTFIQPRIGHLTYVYYYTFPWFYLSVLRVLQGHHMVKKIIWSIVAAFFFVFTLYLNLYFFVSLAFSAGLFFVFYLVTKRQILFKKIFENIFYGVLFFASCALFLFPWLKIFIETATFEELPRTTGWGGAIEFSSDLFGYFVPSIYSYFMSPLTVFIGKHAQFTVGIFENFSYPGLIILISFGLLGALYFIKQLGSDISRRIAPFLFMSLSFWVLTLGPFLHVFGRWGITVEENIRVVLPLPYVLFHYLPFMANIRSPGRLVAIWIFFSYIVVALLLDRWLQGRSSRFIRNTLVLLACIFIIDHYFLIPSPGPNPLPLPLYERIREDTRQLTVMELPFVVRDGFTYFGDNGALDFITGQQYHNKPVIGGYMGRVPHFKREYYVRNPLLGYFGRLVDTDIKNNGSLERSDQALARWKQLDPPLASESAEFLDIAYVIVRQHMPYTATAEADLKQLGYLPISKALESELWYRAPSNREFLTVTPGTPGDEMYLGAGWNIPDPGFRWANQKTSVLFKVVKSKPQTLQFTAAAYHRSRKMEIYVNRKYISTVDLDVKEVTKSISVDNIVTGVNTVHFLFDGYDVPAEVSPGSSDMRELSAKFSYIGLK